MRIVVNKHGLVYLDFGRVGTMQSQLIVILNLYHRLWQWIVMLYLFIRKIKSPHLYHRLWQWIVMLYLFIRKIKSPHYYASLKLLYHAHSLFHPCLELQRLYHRVQLQHLKHTLNSTICFRLTIIFSLKL